MKRKPALFLLAGRDGRGGKDPASPHWNERTAAFMFPPPRKGGGLPRVLFIRAPQRAIEVREQILRILNPRR